MFDVIVVGARCAGSPTAMLLARRGHRVLLVDRAKFPSDTISTHFIQLPGIARLHRWGVLDAVLATGCPPITRGRLDVDGVAADADFPILGALPGIAAPRRTVLDKVLVDAAADAGVEVAEGVMIGSLLFQDDRVVGVSGHSALEPSFLERARIVIGADGRNAFVARSVGAGFKEHTPALGGGYYSYWSGVECSGAELYLYEGAFAVAFPTNEGLTTVALVVPPERFSEMRKDDERNVLAELDRLGDLGERLRSGRREHKLVPVANLTNFLRKPWGAGWALVGDAAYHKDPTPADGITDAFRGADLLAAAVDEFLKGAHEEKVLARYEHDLRTRALPLLEKTLIMSSFQHSPIERGTAFLEIQGMHAEETVELLDQHSDRSQELVR